MMGLFGDLIGLAVGAAGWKQGERNYDLQKEQFDYEKDIQQKQWLREDTAYQRKVADLKAAGLNPILAAGGSGSPTSSPIQVHAPQNESMEAFSHLGKFEGVREALALMQQKKDIAVSTAQEKLINLQKEKTAEETNKTMWEAKLAKDSALTFLEWKGKEIEERQSRINNMDKDLEIKNYDFNKAKETGVASGAVQNGNSTIEFNDAMKKALKYEGGNPVVDALLLLTSKFLDTGTVNQGLRMLPIVPKK